MTDTELEPKTVGMKVETDRHWRWSLHSLRGPPLSLVCLPLLPPPFPTSSIIFYLFSHHEMNFFHIFWSGRIGRVLHSPLLLISLPSQAPFSFLVFMNIFIWKELRKMKLISLSSHFPHLVTPSPTKLKLGPPPTPPEHLYIVCLRFVPQ